VGKNNFNTFGPPWKNLGKIPGKFFPTPMGGFMNATLYHAISSIDKA